MRVDDVGTQRVELAEDAAQVGRRRSQGGIEVERDVELWQRHAGQTTNAIAIALLVGRRAFVFGRNDYDLVAAPSEALCQLSGEMRAAARAREKEVVEIRDAHGRSAPRLAFGEHAVDDFVRCQQGRSFCGVVDVPIDERDEVVELRHQGLSAVRDHRDVDDRLLPVRAALLELVAHVAKDGDILTQQVDLEHSVEIVHAELADFLLPDATRRNRGQAAGSECQLCFGHVLGGRLRLRMEVAEAGLDVRG